MTINQKAIKKRDESNNLDLASSYVNKFDLDIKKDTKLRVVKKKSREIIDISDPFGGGLNFYNKPKLSHESFLLW